MTDDDHNIEVPKGELNVTTYPVTITLSELINAVTASPDIPEYLKDNIAKWIKDNWPLIAGILKAGKSLDLENLDSDLPDWLVENWPEIARIVEKLIELTGGV